MSGRGRAVGSNSGFTLVELLVVMGIILVLAGMLVGATFALRTSGRKKGAKADIEAIGVGMAAYFQVFGKYPPDVDGFRPDMDSNECLVYYLGRKIRRGLNSYGPFVDFKENKLEDRDNDTFKEYRDPFDNLYQYAENRSEDTETGRNPKSYDLVSPGDDAELGGSMSVSTGYVTATGQAQIRFQNDNITNWSQ